MKKADAVNILMREGKADESFRPFFEDVVDNWMGEAKTVRESDLEGIREHIKRMI